MSVQDLGSIGELVAAIATIATLFYLALQIRHNSKIGRVNVEQGTFETQTSLYHLILNNPELIDLAHGFFEGDEVDEKDLGRLQNLMMYGLEVHQHWFGQHKLGLLEQDALDSNWVKLLIWVGNEPGYAWFQRNKHHFRADFVSYVENRLQEDRRGTKDVFEVVDAQRGQGPQ